MFYWVACCFGSKISVWRICWCGMKQLGGLKADYNDVSDCLIEVLAKALYKCS
jgi:hypothetical protein